MGNGADVGPDIAATDFIASFDQDDAELPRVGIIVGGFGTRETDNVLYVIGLD